MIEKIFAYLLALIFVTSMFGKAEHVEKFFSLMHIIFS